MLQEPAHEFHYRQRHGFPVRAARFFSAQYPKSPVDAIRAWYRHIFQDRPGRNAEICPLIRA